MVVMLSLTFKNVSVSRCGKQIRVMQEGVKKGPRFGTATVNRPRKGNSVDEDGGTG